MGFYRAAQKRESRRRANGLEDVGMAVWDGKGAHKRAVELRED